MSKDERIPHTKALIHRLDTKIIKLQAKVKRLSEENAVLKMELASQKRNEKELKKPMVDLYVSTDPNDGCDFQTAYSGLQTHPRVN